MALLIRMISLGLIILLAYTLSQITWMLLEQPSSDAGAIVAENRNDSAPVQQAPGLGYDLASRHLFGKADAKTAPATPKTQDVPKTRLNLILHGVVAADDEETARAIIGSRGGKEDVYAVGEKIPGGRVTLDSIHVDHVVLNRQGRMEALYLPKKTTSKSATAGNRASRGAPTASQPLGSFDPKEGLNALRDAWRKGPSHLLTTLSPKPVRENGNLIGYKVTNPRGDLAERVGLRDGDILTEVNGIKVGDSARVGSLMRTLPKAKTINVILLRDGVSQTLTLGGGG